MKRNLPLALDYKYAECNSCELIENRDKSFVHTQAPTKDFCGIMIILEAPTQDCFKNDLPIAGGRSTMLDSLLQAAEIDRDSCYIANAVSCCSSKKTRRDVSFTETHPTAVPSCLPRLLAEIEAYKPRIVLAMGQTALTALTGDDVQTRAKFTTPWKTNWVAGGVFDAKKLGIVGVNYLVPTYHPSFLMHKAGGTYSKQVGGQFISTAVIEHLKKAKRLLTEEPSFKVFRTVAISSDIFRAYTKKIAPDIYYAVDIETNAREPKDVTNIKCIGIQRFTDKELLEETMVVETSNLSGDLQKSICDFMENESINKVFQNGLYDIEVLERLYGCKVNGYVGDTLLAHNALYPDEPHHLHHIAFTYTDAEPWKTQDHKYKDQKELWLYNAKDTRATAESMRVLSKYLKKNDLVDVHKTDIALFRLAAEMNQRGIAIDRDKLKDAEISFLQKKARLLHEMQVLTGIATFNPDSASDIATVLFDSMKLRSVDKKTDSVSLLNHYDNEMVKKILEYRRVNHIYWNRKNMEVVDGKIFFKWNPIALRNGLWSSNISFEGWENFICTNNTQEIIFKPFSMYEAIAKCVGTTNAACHEKVSAQTFGDRGAEKCNSLVSNAIKLMFKGYDDVAIRNQIIRSPLHEGPMISIAVIKNIIKSFYELVPLARDYQQLRYQLALKDDAVRCEYSGRRRIFPFGNVDSNIAYWFPFQACLANEINQSLINEQRNILAITEDGYWASTKKRIIRSFCFDDS